MQATKHKILLKKIISAKFYKASTFLCVGVQQMNTDEYLYMTNKTVTVIFANLLVYMTMHILS